MLPRSITTCGTCDEAALSRYTSGLPLTVWRSTGKSSRMRCTSKPTSCVFVKTYFSIVAMRLRFKAGIQPIQNCCIELIAYGFKFDFCDDFFGEPVSQKISAEVRMNAASFKVKQFFFINLPYRRAMR